MPWMETKRRIRDCESEQWPELGYGSRVARVEQVREAVEVVADSERARRRAGDRAGVGGSAGRCPRMGG